MDTAPTKKDELRLLQMAECHMIEARRELKAVIDLRFVMGEMTEGLGVFSDIITYLKEFAEEIRMIREK